MEQEEKKRKGCLNLLIKGVIIYFVLSLILGAILAVVMPDFAQKDYEEALANTTALMDAKDYDGAINRLDQYWEEYSMSSHTDLADLYIQCYEAQERYDEAANIIISIFQEQGYEDPIDGELHTRLSGILPNLSQESQDQIRQTLDALPDSLEEKQALEKEQEAAAEKAEQDAKAQKEAEEKAAALAESEQKEREILQNAFNDGEITTVATRNQIKEACTSYLEKYPDSSYAETVKQIMTQLDTIQTSNATISEIGSGIEQEYEKIRNVFYGEYYINYKLEYAEGLDSIIGSLQDTMGDDKKYIDWVASDFEYFYDTVLPGDNVYIIRTQRTFSNAGVYGFNLIPDGSKKLSRSGGFEFTAEVYREVSNAYIDTVYLQYDAYLTAKENVKNAYSALEQLRQALTA